MRAYTDNIAVIKDEEEDAVKICIEYTERTMIDERYERVEKLERAIAESRENQQRLRGANQTGAMPASGRDLTLTDTLNKCADTRVETELHGLQNATQACADSHYPDLFVPHFLCERHVRSTLDPLEQRTMTAEEIILTRPVMHMESPARTRARLLSQHTTNPNIDVVASTS